MSEILLDDVGKKSRFLINPDADLAMMRREQLSMDAVLKSIDRTHTLIGKFKEFDVDVFSLLGMRNLSAFIGEIFAAQMVHVSDGTFRKNPHQDGYPDLLLMDKEGAASWGELSHRLKEKGPFSPFPTGGLEVKATCGAVPTPVQCAKRGLEKPGLGDQRIAFLTGYDWKAHHQQTNNLIGLFWDFIDGAPHIIGVFYSSKLTPADWGAIIQPREGGGRTTSVSIMTRAGVRKMCNSWLVVLNDQRYLDFFSRYNSGVTFAS